MTIFCAEISSNHNREIDRCLQIINAAADIGCRAVKLQLFKIDELFAPEILEKSAEHRRRRAWELPAEWIPRLAEECRRRKVELICTPFYLEAVDELTPYVDRLKIASYELLWNDLLHRCAASGKPIVLSTGMATLAEVEKAVAVLREAGCRDLTLLHCTSSYPTPATECNLAVLETFRQAFGCHIGWSDHSRDPAVVLRAVQRWSASFVELHIDLDGRGVEHEFGHCWLPGELEPVIKRASEDIEDIEDHHEADGNGLKGPTPSELSDREWRADPSDGLRPLAHIRDTFDPERND